VRAGGLVLIVLCACTLDVPPSWLLGDDPEVIGLRMEVISDGPYSTGFLPIPADRVRSEALPGDTIRFVPLAADIDGVVELAPLDPHWILSGGSLNVARQTSGTCVPEQPIDPDTACMLGRGAEIDFVVPPLLRGVPLVEQRPSIVLVAGIDRSSAECVELLASDSLVGASECLIAFRRINLGPVPRIGEIAIEQGVPLPDNLEGIDLSDEALAMQPDFSPIPPYLSFWGAGLETLIWPDEVTTVPADAGFDMGFGVDARDMQDFVSVNALGEIQMRSEDVSPQVHITAPALVGSRFAASAGFDPFLMFVVATDSRRSQSWAVFEFEVAGE
jgi:hypothetical protein